MREVCFWYSASELLIVDFFLPPGESDGEASWGAHTLTEPQHGASAWRTRGAKDEHCLKIALLK